MRVVARSFARQFADVDRRSVRVRDSAQQLRHPRIVVEAVIDDDPCRGEGSCDRGARLEQVRILIGIGENARHLDIEPADLLRDVAIKVFGGQNSGGLLGRRQGWRDQQSGGNECGATFHGGASEKSSLTSCPNNPPSSSLK
jgi:hypothetical protein